VNQRGFFTPLSVKISDDFVLLGKKDQREMLIFEDQVYDWSDDQLIDELRKLIPAYKLLCDVAAEEKDPRTWRKLVYHTRQMDLKKTIMENELVRREFR
jgi:hypothetical protein